MIVIVMAIAWLVLTVIWTVYEERKWLYRMTKQPLQELMDEILQRPFK